MFTHPLHSRTRVASSHPRIRSLVPLLLLLTPHSQAQVWTSIGPSQVAGPNGPTGRITSLAVDPVDPSHWMLGSAGGGVWDSHDAGANWTPLTDSQPTLAIGSVAFAPSDSTIIYAGTGEANYVPHAQAGQGMLKSTDGGANWTVLGVSTFRGASIGAIRVDQANPDIVVAVMSRAQSGRDNEPFLALRPPAFGVQRSTDGGATWVRTLDGEATALEIDPANFNNQYTAISLPVTYGAYGVPVPPAPSGLYRSADGGQNWSLVRGPWSDSRVGRIVLAIAPSNRDTLYASFQGADQHLLGLFRTDNAWATTPTWVQVPTNRDWSIGGVSYVDFCGSTCTAAQLLSVDPTDPNALYAGGASLWRCDQCGTEPTWTDIGAPAHAGKRCAVWSGELLITCTDGGVFSATSQSGRWQSNNGGLQVARFSSGALHPTDPNFVIGGTLDNGSASWIGVGTWLAGPLDEGEVAISSKRPSLDRMVSSSSRIFRTTNGGQTFPAADAGFDRTGYNGGFLPVRKCPANDDVFLSGTTRIQRSNNFFTGATASWNANGPAGDLITAIAFAAADTDCNTYAYGTSSGRIFLTADGGGNWSDLDVKGNLPTRSINSLEFDPTNSSVLYAAFSSFDQASQKRGHLFKTASALSSVPRWENISPGVNLPFNVVVVDPGTPDSVFAGTDAGVWYSPDGGVSWSFLGPSTGLPNVPVYDLKVNSVTKRIMAFTYGRGAWSLDLKAFSLSGPPVSLSGSPSLQATLASSFSLQLTAAGSPPFSWSIASGSLPPGVVLLNTGEIVGTPLGAGVYKFTVVVKDGSTGIASQQFTLSVGTAGTAPVWTNIGPAPLIQGFNAAVPEVVNSGRVASITVDPSDPNRWLIGFGNGGIWESRDAGTTFRPIADWAPTLATGAVAFAPSDPKIIYAGTGEATLPLVTKAGLGMLKSTDGGETWTVVGASTFARASVRWVRVHPAKPNIVLATVSRGGFGRDYQAGVPGSPPFGIVKSSDGGATWTRTLAGSATALEIDPKNFNNQYAAIGETITPSGLNNDSAGSVPNGLYRSTDGGQTWSPILGPWGASTASRTSTGRLELALAPSESNVLYASVAVPGDAARLLGLYRTDNAWAAIPSWIQIPTDNTGDGGYCGPEHCHYSHVISVDPSNANTVFAGGGETLWRCSNCGVSPIWTNVTQKEGVHVDYHSLVWVGQRLIVGNDGGIWSTPDGGGSWQNHNAAISANYFISGDLHPADPNYMLGALRDSSVMIRADGAWSLPPSRAPLWGEAEVAISASRPNTDWMGATEFGQILRTLNGDATHTQADVGIDKTAAAFVAPVRKCPNNDDMFLTGTNRIYRSDNFFSSASPTWTPNGPVGLPNQRGSSATILAIAYFPSDTSCNTYAYGTRGGVVQLTRDGGRTWTDVDAGRSLPARPVNWLAFDPVNSSILYAVFSSFDSATSGKPGHVFRTANAGAQSPAWTNISPPQDQPFNVIAVDPVNPLLVFAGSDIGLWRSNDSGATWLRQGPDLGIPNVPVNDIKINPATGRTVVFTYGRGAYTLGPELIASSCSPTRRVTHIAAGTVPRSWAQVQGTNLAGVTRTWGDAEFAGSDGLPANLSGVEVKVNEISAAVYSISPTRIIFEVPEGLPGTAKVQVLRDGVPSNTINAGGCFELARRLPGRSQK